jgi:hypothetical protein
MTGTAKTAVILVWLLWSTGALAGPPAIELGRYSTVTESEWSMNLDLKAEGLVALEVASWEPGESAHAKVDRYSGRWHSEKSDVIVRFKEGEAILNYHPRLSFEEFGRTGAAAGLVGVSATVVPHLLVGRSLWLERELPKLKW